METSSPYCCRTAENHSDPVEGKHAKLSDVTLPASKTY